MITKTAPMGSVSRSERNTQNRVVDLFTDKARPVCLGCRALGDWTDRPNNRPIEADILRANFQERGYTPAQISPALLQLEGAADLPEIIKKWEKKFQVQLRGFSLQRMKTKWGTCNHRARTIRLNSELAKKPKDLLDYVVAHEMAHLVEPSHNDEFHALLDKHCPSWREARLELNELPLGAEAWVR